MKGGGWGNYIRFKNLIFQKKSTVELIIPPLQAITGK